MFGNVPGGALVEAWESAAQVAEDAGAGTARFAATKSRARTHGEKSVGRPDPGATSFAILMKVVPQVIK